MIEAQIKESLQELRRSITLGDGEAIASSLTELDRLTAEHGGGLNPQLLHFLQNRSYEKAMAFLGGDSDIPAGNCGGRG
jgi:hypothetical protein